MSTAGDPLMATIESWRDSILRRDIATASALRDDAYVVELSGGKVMTKTQELAALASGQFDVERLRFENLRIERNGSRATASFDWMIEREDDAGTRDLLAQSTVVFELRGERWIAIKSKAAIADVAEEDPKPRPFFERVLGSIRKKRAAPATSTFQELAYIPYKPGEDFALPRTAAPAYTPGSKLPIPPKELWLGYNYPATGKVNVARMLEIVKASRFEFRRGDRILDFGCGAGRMIRHLQHLAETCEIWGTDISAAHILWSKRNLSPPFHFATTTKVPHLPFEDRSFRFIYCGSVFTHIDDLADAWLLELHRILAPGGLLYVTIHDQHTVALIERGEADWLRQFTESPVYKQHKDSFDMLVIGRDDLSQVFYDRDVFLRMLGGRYEVVSVTPEAYFYQTAVLAQRL